MEIIGYAVIEESGMVVSTYQKDERAKAVEEMNRLNKKYGPFYTVVYIEK